MEVKAKDLKQAIELIEGMERTFNVEFFNKKNKKILTQKLAEFEKKNEVIDYVDRRLTAFEDEIKGILMRQKIDSIPSFESPTPPSPSIPPVSWISRKVNDEIEEHKCSNGHSITVTRDKTGQFSARVDSGPSKATTDAGLAQLKKYVEGLKAI